MKSKSNLYAPILFGSIMILAGFSKKLTELAEKMNVDTFLSVFIIQLIVFLLPLAFYCKLCGINYATSLKFKYVETNKISFCLIMTALFLLGNVFLRYFGITFFRGAMTQTTNIVFAEVSGGKKILSVFGFVILPAIFEEMVFRGILYAEYENYSAFSAIFITSLMYAMAHMSFQNFMYYFFAGIIFSVLTHVTKSIVPALILHLLSNFIYYFFGANVVDYIRQTGKSALLPFIVVSLILLCLFFMFSSLEGIYQEKAMNELMQSRKEILRQATEQNNPEEEKKSGLKILSEACLSPTFAACVIIFILLSANLF